MPVAWEVSSYRATMALVRVTELIFAMPRIRIGANYFYFMNTFTRIPGAAVEPETRPDGLRWRFDALNIFRKRGAEAPRAFTAVLSFGVHMPVGTTLSLGLP